MILNKLNARERTLALLLGGTAFLLLNLLFLPRLTASNQAGKRKQAELKAQLGAAEGWVKNEAYWQERKKWLQETEPTLNAAREESATQLEELQATARKLGVQINGVELLQLPETEFYQPIGAKLTVSGPWPGLVEFVAKLQDPVEFDVIPRFSVKSADEPPNVICEMEVQRWFHKPKSETP